MWWMRRNTLLVSQFLLLPFHQPPSAFQPGMRCQARHSLRAGVGEGTPVCDKGWAWDGMGGAGRIKRMEPPSKVVSGVSRGVVGKKGVCAEGSHEAFQTGEVSSPGREHQASVEKLAVQLLGLLEVMSGV